MKITDLKDKETAVTIPANEEFVKPYMGFITSFSQGLGAAPEKFDDFVHTLGNVLELIVEDNTAATRTSDISITSKQTGADLTVEILNHGRPLFLDQPDVQERLNKSTHRDHLSYENRGRKGQLITLKLGPLGEAKNQIVTTHDLTATNAESSAVAIRLLRPGEEPELSRLFHTVYGYNYINEFVYFPKKMKKMIDQGDLISLVAARPDGSFIGHVGLIRWNKNPEVYEAALGVVDPNAKGKGIFSQLFDHGMQILKPLPMQYCVFDFVTNHDFTQRLVAKYNYSDMALLLGNQVSLTQARLEELGLGQDPTDTDRYSLLIGVRAQSEHPFGREVVLPVNLGEPCDFILRPLNISWVPAPRFYPLAAHGEYVVKLQKEQRSVIFELKVPGREALDRIIEEWRQLLREGYQYFAIDFPLDKSGVGQAYDLLSQHGFFMAGFVPWQFTDVLAFRFQFLIPTKVNFDAIKVFSKTGQAILKMVREDYERNKIL